VKNILNKAKYEKKLVGLLSNLERKNTSNLLEASGVIFVNDNYLVVFDEMHGIAKLPKSTDSFIGKGVIVGSQHNKEGFEAITYDSRSKVIYALVENTPYKDGFFRPQIQQFTMDLVKVGSPVTLPLNLPLDNVDSNKGLEGACIIHKADRTFLFGLCEGKGCNSDDSKEAKGRGVIQIFEHSNDKWNHLGHLKLPEEVDFRDYSDLAIRQNHIAVTSQKSAKLWVGLIQPTTNSWSLTHQNIYSFPQKNNKILYCNIEGVDWISDKQLVFVSDMASKKSCKAKEMMIHIFDIPH